MDITISKKGHNSGTSLYRFKKRLFTKENPDFRFNQEEYHPCSNPFVFSKIWPRQESVMKKGLRGDNYVNIQGRIMVLVHCPSSHCHLSINKVLLQSLLYFQRYGPDR